MSGNEMSRRRFVQGLSVGGAVMLGAPIVLYGCEQSDGGTGPTGDQGAEPHPLRFAPQVTPDGITLTGAPGVADIGGGVLAPAWMLNGSLPSPLLRVRRGAPFRVTMQNQLPQELILHWHGLAPPVEMDGHPRFAVAPGASRAYEFTVEDRAGTYWYHSHTHMRTGEHTYRGIAGMLIVNDDEEDALGLPSGARELPIILQDRRLDASGIPVYSNAGPAMMAGVMGSEPFGNGVRRPYYEADTAVYRLRLLNGSNARIFRLALSNGAAMTLIGNDGGLLPAPVSLTTLDLAPAERADILLDLRGASVGARVMLLEFRVARAVEDTTVIPTALPAVPLPDPAAAINTRTFRFQSQMMVHTINGSTFAMDRVDATVPFDTTELWSFVNESGFPHPVHLHATHFRVVSRTGGRGQVMPWEAGRKDTVLLHPFESVQVAVRFTAHRGLYLLHCHNLEHEDMGMMANILIE
jgi:FtsP/CotA-like multicopper oxidase with cupredoxin domain